MNNFVIVVVVVFLLVLTCACIMQVLGVCHFHPTLPYC